MASMEFHDIHGISWIHELYIVSTKFSWNPRGFHGLHEVSMEPTKFSWNPRSFHGLHEVSMEPTKFSWNPRTFHGLHKVFMESTMFSWSPRNFHGIHEGRGIHENSPRNFHEVRGIHGKANWIVPLNQYFRLKMAKIDKMTSFCHQWRHFWVNFKKFWNFKPYFSDSQKHFVQTLFWQYLDKINISLWKLAEYTENDEIHCFSLDKILRKIWSVNYR